jgi:hypothetical protein
MLTGAARPRSRLLTGSWFPLAGLLTLAAVSAAAVPAAQAVPPAEEVPVLPAAPFAPVSAVAARAGAGLSDPVVNATPAVDYYPVCSADPAGAACIAALLTDIDQARAAEGVPVMVLPRGYPTMPAARQLFVVTNLERVDRGLPAVTGLSTQLDTEEQHWAALDRETTGEAVSGQNGAEEEGQFALGVFNVLEADWIWMYQDGWGGASGTANGDCGSVAADGCWGHREGILHSYTGYDSLVAGGGGSVTGEVSYDYLVSGGNRSGAGPVYSYTWAQAEAAGADGATGSAAASVAQSQLLEAHRPGAAAARAERQAAVHRAAVHRAAVRRAARAAAARRRALHHHRPATTG